MISCHRLDSALPLEDLEQQHKQNIELLKQCRVQRAMLASQREMLSNRNIETSRFADPNPTQSTVKK